MPGTLVPKGNPKTTRPVRIVPPKSKKGRKVGKNPTPGTPRKVGPPTAGKTTVIGGKTLTPIYPGPKPVTTNAYKPGQEYALKTSEKPAKKNAKKSARAASAVKPAKGAKRVGGK